MMRKLWAASVMLAVGLTGCLGASGPTEPVAPTGTEDLLPVASGLPEGIPGALLQHGCVEHLGVYPFPMEEAAMYLPDGWTAVPFDPLGRTATLIGLAYECMHAEADGEHYAGENFGVLVGGLDVLPPEEYRVEGYNVLTLGVLTNDADLAAMYEAWGVDVLPTDEWTFLTQGAGPARAGMASAGSGGFTVEATTASAGPPASQAAGTSRWFTVHGGEVTGAMDWSWTEAAGIEMGVSVLRITDGMPIGIPPAMPGLGFHFWGDDYAYELAYVPGDALTAPMEDAAEEEPAALPVRMPATGFRGLA